MCVYTLVRFQGLGYMALDSRISEIVGLVCVFVYLHYTLTTHKHAHKHKIHTHTHTHTHTRTHTHTDGDFLSSAACLFFISKYTLRSESTSMLTHSLVQGLVQGLGFRIQSPTTRCAANLRRCWCTKFRFSFRVYDLGFGGRLQPRHARPLQPRHARPRHDSSARECAPHPG